MDDFFSSSVCCSMAVSRLAIFWVTGIPRGFGLLITGDMTWGEEGLCRWQSALLPLSLVCHIVSHLLGECLQVDPGGVKLGPSVFSQGEGCARGCRSQLSKACLRDRHPFDVGRGSPSCSLSSRSSDTGRVVVMGAGGEGRGWGVGGRCVVVNLGLHAPRP